MDIIAEIEGAIADSLGATNMMESIIGVVQSSMAAAQATLMESQYLAAIPIIAAEFKGLVDILQGSGELFIGSLESLQFFIPDFFDGIFTLMTFAISWLMCLFKNITNLQACMFYYLLEIVGVIFYLPFRVTLWVLSQFHIDLYDLETQFWDGIEYIDEVVLNYAGFHVSHYPKNIREQCYNCRRVKISALDKHTAPLVKDLTQTVPSLLSPGLKQIIKGGTELMNPFDY